ncbi:hypothetical protein [Cucumibacter marinus]|uniref:hypothetical protein n=1 Tax=Cucumibacter marinus TaxID=1121252 RepID=UPI0003F8FC75|nr:hypothetical protein [Cucumibacter marinus]
MHARYTEPTSGMVLQFIPYEFRKAHTPSTSSLFTLTLPGEDEPVFAGEVSWNMGWSRPNGMLTPPGCLDEEPAETEEEAMGPDFEGCTIWEGVVYALGDEGITPLPAEESDPAPRQVLLTDLGRTLRYGVWDYDRFQGDILADDVFTLDGCAS